MLCWDGIGRSHYTGNVTGTSIGGFGRILLVLYSNLLEKYRQGAGPFTENRKSERNLRDKVLYCIMYLNLLEK